MYVSDNYDAWEIKERELERLGRIWRVMRVIKALEDQKNEEHEMSEDEINAEWGRLKIKHFGRRY